MTVFSFNPVNDIRTEVIDNETGVYVGVIVLDKGTYLAEADGRYIGRFDEFDTAAEEIAAILAGDNLCGMCGEQFDTHPFSGEKTCFVHGNPKGSSHERLIWMSSIAATEKG